MRSVSYTLLDPTGNMTLLAETPVPEALRPDAARLLMELEPSAEQVGFVSLFPDGAELRMAGGEFCGNAAMSAASLYLARSDRGNGNVSVRVSGADEPVSASMTALSGGAWRGAVTMPPPISVRREALPGGRTLPVIRFPGIAHVLLEEEMTPDAAEALAPDWCRELEADALGLLFLDRTRQTLRPLVYVPAAGTLCWESSCASGTAAAGAFLAADAGHAVELSLIQPGGTLSIAAEPDGRLLLTGTVRIIHSASAALPI